MKKTLIILFLCFLPVLAFAQIIRTNCPPADALIPCGGSTCPCTLCDFFVMIDRIVDFALTRVIPVAAVLMIVIVGAMMVASYAGQSGPEMISKAKKLLGSIIIGLLIVYLAWVIVNLFLMSLGVADWTGFDTWWRINCEASPIVFPGPIGVSGCTDELARNFNPNATVDDGSCIYGGVGICGDSIIQTPNSAGTNEVCDGMNLGDGTCELFGYSSEATGLECQSDCLAFESANCIEPVLCGNGAIDSGEACDTALSVTCPSNPAWSASCVDSCTRIECVDPCGNGTMDPGEECDYSVADTEWAGCADPRFVAVCSLMCAMTCVDQCGNGTIDEGEMCDCGPDGDCTPEELGFRDCTDYGYDRGELGCVDCNYDVAACVDCGNGVIESGEECDCGSDGFCALAELGGNRCEDMGYPGGGILDCNNCAFDEAGCIAESCGNGRIDAGEECDWNGPVLGGESCSSLGYEPGPLDCFLLGPNQCTFDRSGCGDLLLPEIGDRIFNCQYAGATMGRWADFNYPEILLQGIWSINRVNYRDGRDWYTSCVWSGTAANDGWKNLNTFASANPDGSYLAYAGFDGSFFFFEVVDGRLVIRANVCGNGAIDPGEVCDPNGPQLGGATCDSLSFMPGVLDCSADCSGYDTSGCGPKIERCLTCPGNADGLCDIVNCPITGGCNYVIVDLLFGVTGGICVNPTDCVICGTTPDVPTNVCDSVQCNSIGPLCTFILEDPITGRGSCF